MNTRTWVGAEVLVGVAAVLYAVQCWSRPAAWLLFGVALVVDALGPAFWRGPR